MITFAQGHIYLSESFDGDALPEGWSTSEVGASNWKISVSKHAGGEANEIMLDFFPPIFMETTRLISPAVDLSSTNEVVVSFKHCLNNNIDAEIQETPYILGVATSTDKENWNVAWQEEYTVSDVYNIFEVVNTPDLGNSNVHFCLFFTGSTLTLNGWAFDDFVVSTQNNLELELTSIDMPEMINYGEHEVQFTVQNLGSTAITSFEAQLTNGGNIVKETFETNIEALAFQRLTFSNQVYFNPGSQNVKIEILSVNGTSGGNNTLDKNVEVGMGYASKTPMIEHFSSSTCGYCVEPNQIIKQVLADNPGKYTYTKYPTKFPAPGDPYTTDEVKNRVNYYKVSGAPEFYLDGFWKEYEIVSPEDINSIYGSSTFFDMRGSFTVEGNTINITADFMSYIKMDSVRAYISVNEKTTTENTLPIDDGGNGETEFHHIMMKLNDIQGQALNLKAGEPQRVEFSYDMTQTFMEDINDLEVALWIQNYETHEIYNSRYAYEYTEHCYPARNLSTMIEGNSFTARWDAPEKGNPVGYNVYVDGELVAEKTTSLEYSSELNDKKVIAVMAVYENERTSVCIAKMINSEENISETISESFQIYPNPAKDEIRISSNERIEEVTVYNVNGQQTIAISQQLSANSCTINIANLNSGIYIVKINTEKGNIVKRFIKY